MPGDAVYQLRVVLRGISPPIWRRLLVDAETSIAGLHAILQTAFSWSDDHLHRFTVHGMDYGLWRPGGTGFSHNAHHVRLAGFALRVRERFSYQYDFIAQWHHDILVKQILTPAPRHPHPACTRGARQAPPEDACCSVTECLRLRRDLSPLTIAGRMAEVLSEILAAPDEATCRELVLDHREGMLVLHRYALLDDFDRRPVNRALHQLGLDTRGIRP
ncbi:plasmid pRiA4b ORF-3 family protein [Streptomyces sp. NPDC059002]|uniref:plasmid pRiA4b ORF-3 family protein n=1 Tax=Streptomyces sp. NPDC059002 TaxID=3346690 RepID=UPI0036937FAC